MADGIWPAARAHEPYRQAWILRHKPLRINLDPNGALEPMDASSYGSVAPSSLVPVSSSRGLEGGAHFVLSPQSPDGRPTLGFQWCLLYWNDNGDSALPLGDGFTVTVWQLIAETQMPNGLISPQWAAFEPLTDVGFRELYSTFDTNACAVRFQIENYNPVVGQTSISIYLTEL